MTNYRNHNFQEDSLELPQLIENPDSLGKNRSTRTRIRIRIPKEYGDEPIISKLVSQYGLTVNISAAFLGASARDDGWFDLEL